VSQKVELFCKEGTADKIYVIWIEPEGKGLMVKANWGRRGGPMQSGNKTKSPVDKDEAEKVFNKTITEKLGKGYKYAENGQSSPEYTHVASTTAKDSGLRPMLLTPADESDIDRFVNDDAWGAQEKKNGKHIILVVKDGVVKGVNKAGKECPIPVEVENAFRSTNDCVLDGELIGAKYFVFDMIDTTNNTLVRHTNATLLVVNVMLDNVSVDMVPMVAGKQQKRAFVEKLREGKKEGVVFKRLDGKYEAGRSTDVETAQNVKVKFWSEISAQVIAWTGKQSIEVGLADKKGAIVSIGKVTVAEKYNKQVTKGSIVRVKYLYATENSVIYQSHLDATDDGNVLADQDKPDCITALKITGSLDV
jgi:bifunctional non-homologous end joining protein LigD